MTFSRSKRLLKAYKHCRGYYYGTGPAGKEPTRLRVRTWKCPHTPWRFAVLLFTVEVKK